MADSDNSTEQQKTAYTTPRADVSAMVPQAALSVLDVGCSNGALGESLCRACPGRQVFGIEIDPAFALQARRHLQQVVCADLNELDWAACLPGVQFDCIIFADVLEHLIDPRRHLMEAQRRLRPGGCIVVSLPNIRHVSSLYSIFIKGTFPLRERGIFDKTHMRWFTINDARRLVAGLGMRVAHTSYILRLGDRGGGMLNRIVNRLPRPIQGLFLIREFLTYQFCVCAVNGQ